jgi:SAM-dependent methyltransferase
MTRLHGTGETSKTREQFGELERSIVRGRVLDIGAGPDPITPEAIVFDLEHGDANHITAFPPESFDLVYSSHCLEHMHDPRSTLLNWWSLVKPGGHLFVIVPDEDLYEQGVFPSRFNADHKHTFTISKKRSWSPKSVNVLELAQLLPDGVVLSLVLNDTGYDRSVSFHGPTSQNGLLRWLRKTYRSLRKRNLIGRKPGFERWLARNVGWDQLNDRALAQIELIVRKRG